MTEHATIWSRLGTWLKNAGRGGSGLDNLPKLHADSMLNDGLEVLDKAEGEARANLASPKRQREQAIEKLQEGYQQVTGLITSIKEHMEVQDKRSEQMVEALTQLAKDSVQSADNAHTHNENLSAIVTQLQASNDRARRLESSILEIPKLASVQNETLAAIQEDVRAGAEANGHMVQSLERFRETASGWSEASAASTQAIKDTNEATARRDADLNKLIEAQSKRFVWLFAVTVVLAISAIVVGFIR